MVMVLRLWKGGAMGILGNLLATLGVVLGCFLSSKTAENKGVWLLFRFSKMEGMRVVEGGDVGAVLGWCMAAFLAAKRAVLWAVFRANSGEKGLFYDGFFMVVLWQNFVGCLGGCLGRFWGSQEVFLAELQSTRTRISKEDEECDELVGFAHCMYTYLYYSFLYYKNEIKTSMGLVF